MALWMRAFLCAYSPSANDLDVQGVSAAFNITDVAMAQIEG